MSGTGSGNGSDSSNANTGTSIGAASRSKNAPGNRIDIGWKHGTNVLGIAFVDDWVVSKEKGRYWLSDDIVGLVGSLAM